MEGFRQNAITIVREWKNKAEKVTKREATVYVDRTVLKEYESKNSRNSTTQMKALIHHEGGVHGQGGKGIHEHNAKSFERSEYNQRTPSRELRGIDQ